MVRRLGRHFGGNTRRGRLDVSRDRRSADPRVAARHLAALRPLRLPRDHLRSADRRPVDQCARLGGRRGDGAPSRRAATPSTSCTPAVLGASRCDRSLGCSQRPDRRPDQCEREVVLFPRHPSPRLPRDPALWARPHPPRASHRHAGADRASGLLGRSGGQQGRRHGRRAKLHRRLPSRSGLRRSCSSRSSASERSSGAKA